MEENNTLRLTENDQKILKKIIAVGKVPDTVMAKDFHLSQQAVQKIRTKLESLGVIKGYVPVIDFRKVKINLISIMGVKIPSIVWKKYSEQQISERLLRIPYVFKIFRVPSSNISYLLMLGFKDIHQRDKFIKKVETVFSDEIDVVWTYTLSVENIISEDPLSLLYESLDDKFFKFDELFLTDKEK